MFGTNTKPDLKSPNSRDPVIPNLTINSPSSSTSNVSPGTFTKSKPSLKLNMKTHSPAPRSMASISNTIPNFTNSGPFSPGLFTSKRVWVKRHNGTATTLIVNQNDIIDDLKSAIITKFPNALGKFYDPADLTIKMDLQSRKPVTAVPGNSQQPPKKVNIWTQSASPDSGLPSTSPVSTTFKDSVNRMTQNVNLSQYSYINLEPDQNVWNLLDLYFPGGMAMNEAFIIDTPIMEPDPHQEAYHPQGKFFGSSTNLNYYQSTSPVQSNPPYNRSLTPNSANSGNYYHQPHPQYMNSGAIYKDRSASPNNANLKASPLPSGNFHRRSQSNPPQSPISNNLHMKSQNTANTSTNGTTASTTPNANQAVLLLPKNFSLSNTQQSDKKRLSLDENFVRNRDKLLTSPLGKGSLTDNSEDSQSPQPFPTLMESRKGALPKLDVHGRNIEPTLDSPDTPTDQMKMETLNSLSRGSSNSSNSSRGSSGNNSGKNSVSSSKNGGSAKNSANSTKNNSAKSSTSGPSAGGKAGAGKTTTGNPTDSEEKEPETVKRQSSGSKKNELKAKSATEAVLPSISVLVVEDNAINQAILGAFLRKHKVHYEIAKNGEEAIAKWRKGGFHLVLMDIQLPVKSGIEATKEIRYLERINKIGVFAENEQGPKSEELVDSEKLDLEIFRSPVIIVALTASSNSSVDRSNALRAGCNDYLTKPVNLVWLQNKITEWGCMQALIDFDGWKTKRSTFKTSSGKILGSTTTSRSGAQSTNKMILGGSSQRHQKQL